jgi:hypothetical protein
VGGRKIGEIESSSRGRYIRNIADIIPNWSDICSTADILKLGAMSFPKFLRKKYSLIRRNKYGIEDS